MRQTQAGDLRERLTFQSPTASADDGYGNVVNGWTAEFTVSARIAPRLGGETVMAERLAGRQPYIITVRSSSDSRRITTDWRAVDARDPTRVFNIRSAADPDGKRAWIDLLAETGVA